MSRLARARAHLTLLIAPLAIGMALLFDGDGGAGGDSGGAGEQGGEPGSAGGAAGGDAGAGDGGASKFVAPKDQDEFDRMVQDRIRRERAKYADYDDLKGKASKWDEQQAANQTELERAQAERDAAVAERDSAKSAAQETAKRTAVLVAAAASNVTKPEQVYALLDKDAVTIGDDGQVTGAEDAVKAFIAENPHFVGKSNGAGGSADGGARGDGAPGQLTRDDLKTMSSAEIVKAKEEGRLAGLLQGS